ncbi:MAG: serine/threonine-protein kinase [Archangium sp.]|nr:serine/threonine-protein kinase [Archangium sp.]
MKWTTDEFTGKRFGKYEVLCRLAIGGMAEIFLGFARSGPFVGRPVVIKRILNEQREDSNALQMLLDEAKMTATLSHPNVAQVMDLESDGEEILLVIEFITGANVEEIVEAYTTRQEPVPLGFAIAVIREAAQGLGHAHAHKNSRGESMPIIHRDVTPRNVMVDFEGATKVLDFGIARAKGSERRTQAGMVRGTTAYMSPEQAVGKELDPRTDLFSLGTIFHELLTGQRLFYKGNPGQEMAAVYEGEIPLPSKVNRRVPKALDTVVMRILERKLEKRYQTATEFIRDLSLAAGSTAWAKDRCADLVRERFSARQKDIEKLVVRIPRAAPPAAPSAPAYPEGRTIVSKAQPAPINDTDSGARTMVGAAPLADRRPTLTTEPGREVATDPGRPAMRPATPAPQPPTNPVSAGLIASELFDHDDAEDVGARTRIIPGGSMRSLPRISEQPTDPRRAAVPREPQPASAGSSKGVLILSAMVVLLLGAVGGAFIFRQMQAPPPAQASVVRLSLSADRPVAVWLGKQELGTTPISVFVPSGRHLLELREEEGPRRSLELNLPADETEAKMVVTLDSLPQLP